MDVFSMECGLGKLSQYILTHHLQFKTLPQSFMMFFTCDESQDITPMKGNMVSGK